MGETSTTKTAKTTRVRVRILDRVSLFNRIINLLLLGVPVTAMGWAALALEPSAAYTLMAGGVLLTVWAVVMLYRHVRDRAPCDLEVTDDAVLVGGRLRWKRSSIRSVDWSPARTRAGETGAAHVRILHRFVLMMTTIECSSKADARALVDALSFSNESRQLSFHFFSAMTGLILGLFLRRTNVHVDVGLDGFRIRTGKRDRFIPFADVEQLELQNSHRLVFKARGTRKEVWIQLYGFESFLLRVKEAMTNAKDHAADEAAPVVVAPASVGGYRQSAYPKDVLLQTVENVGADIATRTAAAEALDAKLDDEERVRVRTVAATTASPNLRDHLDDLLAMEDHEEHTTPVKRRAPLR